VHVWGTNWTTIAKEIRTKCSKQVSKQGPVVGWGCGATLSATVVLYAALDRRPAAAAAWSKARRRWIICMRLGVLLDRYTRK